MQEIGRELAFKGSSCSAWYVTRRGRSDIRREIDLLHFTVRAKFYALLQQLCSRGVIRDPSKFHPLKGKHHDLWEFRMRAQGAGNFRIFACRFGADWYLLDVLRKDRWHSKEDDFGRSERLRKELTKLYG